MSFSMIFAGTIMPALGEKLNGILEVDLVEAPRPQALVEDIAQHGADYCGKAAPGSRYQKIKAGEIAGKSSNENWAVRCMKRYAAG